MTLKFDTPASSNPIDRLEVVGQPVDRIDGPLKTTGTAPYAGERYDVERLGHPMGHAVERLIDHDAAVPPAYGWVVGSAIARGRIASIDASAAETAPGVLAVVTAGNAGPLDKAGRNTARLLAGPEIEHYHQAVALVVAESFEQARAAAPLVRIDYVREEGSFDLEAARADAVRPEDITGGPPDTAVGDFEGAFAAAPVKLDATYTTSDEAHAMMEPHASLAAWDGDRLTLWTSTQMVAWAAADLARTLRIPKQNVRMVSPYVGGGFGGKLFLRADAVLAALGARAAGRPVKVTLPRPLMFNNTTHRPATIQRVRIGAAPDGTIDAIAHECWSGDLRGGKADAAVHQTRLLYGGPNRMTATRLAVLDLPEGNAMRAPGEATGHMALEAAMDEMAEKLGLDPVEFRIRNDTQVDPEHPERPFSQRPLVLCLRTGAERFGWDRRDARPGRVREAGGRGLLVGMGVAAAIRGNLVTKSSARVCLDDRGIVTVETDMTDIGTGSYTIIAQTAAEMMGVPVQRVRVKLGDSRFPVSSGSGGQFGANCSTAGVYAACMKLREVVAERLGLGGSGSGNGGSGSGSDVEFADGMVVGPGGQRMPIEQAAAADGRLVVEDGIEFGDLTKRYQQSTFGAHFVEVAVDPATGEVRVRRMLAVCACGRILNPKTARSQVIGAMTQGVGAALMEELVVDKRAGFGFFVNHDLAGYEVPVHADIPHQEVIFIDEPDATSSPMKAKGVAELGICGVAAAVANAVYNATGVRVREYPITLDKILGRLPAMA